MHFLNILIPLLAATSAVIALPNTPEAASELEILRRAIENLERRLSNMENAANIERRNVNAFAAMERRVKSVERRANGCCPAPPTCIEGCHNQFGSANCPDFKNPSLTAIKECEDDLKGCIEDCD
ncbi:hypothetical protein TWF694_006598 [Orbilia ellipsospora]|uniref:Uncharacterized protein n=1 Tax=Orbilia ellipsospora TaxID=2528407 RepID=A0AAV9XLI5_9PEZI